MSALLQGLDFEARGGLMRPTSAEREAEISRQRTWAAQTDTKLTGFQEQLLTTGDRAAKTAGEIILGRFGAAVAPPDDARNDAWRCACDGSQLHLASATVGNLCGWESTG